MVIPQWLAWVVWFQGLQTPASLQWLPEPLPGPPSVNMILCLLCHQQKPNAKVDYKMWRYRESYQIYPHCCSFSGEKKKKTTNGRNKIFLSLSIKTPWNTDSIFLISKYLLALPSVGWPFIKIDLAICARIHPPTDMNTRLNLPSVSPERPKKNFWPFARTSVVIVTLVTAITTCHTFYVNKFDYYRNTLWEVLLSSSIL